MNMYIGFYNYYKYYNKNRMFTDISSPIGDDLCYSSVYMGKYLIENGHKINTIDMDDISKFDALVFMDFPKFKNKCFKRLVSDGFNNLYLIIYESEIIRPDNWNMENHKYFKKIFTWNDKYVDNKKYFKINFSHKIPDKVEFNIKNKKKLCTMIVANKLKAHPLELYTERVNTIRWFEQNHPEDFDLYGIGWDKYNFEGILSKLNRFNALRKVLKPRYPSYKGAIKSKKEIYKKYKFAICYENARDIPGYITEKIFDCFFASCVPIYWGAPNITDHIPADAFIGRRNFKAYEELYQYLKNMSDKEYRGYLDAIEGFIESDKIYPFSAEYFVKKIIKEIIGGN
ncbi:hypothetical protein ES705_08721 [subsurface metagenome]